MQQQPPISGAPLDGPADCTIACDEGHLTAHKIILCAHSKYLQEILSKFPNADHPIIILTELNITDIKILVNYMYTGELVISNDGSPTSLLRAAQVLKIESLTDFDDDDEDDQDNLEDDRDMLDEDEDIVDHPSNLHHHQNNNNNHQHIHLDDRRRGNISMGRLNNNNNNNNNHINHHSRHMNNHLHNPNDMDDEDEEEDDVDVVIPSMAAPHKVVSSQHRNNNNNNNISNNNNNSTNKIRCHLCNIGLSDVKCLYRHVLTRHLPEKWGYKCEFCDREFSRDDHLMRHYTTKHKNMEFNREKIRETRRLNREMAKNFHDQISTVWKE